MAELSGEALDALVQAFPGRLQAVVPEGASPSIAADVRMLLDELVNQAGSFEENLLNASERILSGVQAGSSAISKRDGPVRWTERPASATRVKTCQRREWRWFPGRCGSGTGMLGGPRSNCRLFPWMG